MQAPITMFQTYIHYENEAPQAMVGKMFPEFKRQFCNDVFLRQTVEEWADTHGPEFLDKLASPAHRADVFRYICHYQYGGLCLDIKTAFVMPWKEVLQKIDYDWGTAQVKLADALGYNPTRPDDRLIMAIGKAGDYSIFLRVSFYGRPGHPLIRMAIQHAFGGQVLSRVASIEYMIFCHYLWNTISRDMGSDPKVGWNVTPTFGPIYLFQEYHKHAHDTSTLVKNEGHHFVSRDGTLVAFTRCWGWSKGFPDDPSTKERTSRALLASIPEAIAEIREERNRASGHSPQQAKAQPPVPAGDNDIVEQVENSIKNNSFARIMEAVRASQYYRNGLALSEQQEGWLCCAFCKGKGFRIVTESQEPLGLAGPPPELLARLLTPTRKAPPPAKGTGFEVPKASNPFSAFPIASYSTAPSTPSKSTPPPPPTPVSSAKPKPPSGPPPRVSPSPTRLSQRRAKKAPTRRHPCPILPRSMSRLAALWPQCLIFLQLQWMMICHLRWKLSLRNSNLQQYRSRSGLWPVFKSSELL